MKLLRSLLVLLVFCGGTKSARAQRSLLPQHQFSNGMMFSVGVAAGPETWIGLPKFGAYKQFLLHSTRCKSPKLGFRSPKIYVGVEGSVFVLFAGVFSVGPSVGYGRGPFSIDNSLTVTGFYAPESVWTESYWTWNPKFGINFGVIWLKAGPSFYVTQPYEKYNALRIGTVNFNVELLYLAR